VIQQARVPKVKDAVAAAKRARDLFKVIKLGQRLCKYRQSENENARNESSGTNTMFSILRLSETHIFNLLLVGASREVRVGDLVLRIDPRLDLVRLGVLEPVVWRRHTNRASLREMSQGEKKDKCERETKKQGKSLYKRNAQHAHNND
jgi:hypothetical protein